MRQPKNELLMNTVRNSIRIKSARDLKKVKAKDIIKDLKSGGSRIKQVICTKPTSVHKKTSNQHAMSTGKLQRRKSE